MPTVRVHALPRETRDELRRRAEIRGQSLDHYLYVHLMLHAREPDLDAPKTPRFNLGREMNRLYARTFGPLIAAMIVATVVLVLIDQR